MCTEPRLDLQRQVEQGKNALLRRGERRACHRVARPSWMMVSVTSWKVAKRRSAVGWAVARVGFPV